MQNLVTKYQEDKIKLSEKLHFTEKELADEIDKHNKFNTGEHSPKDKVSETSRDSEDVKEYLDRIDVVEKRVDSIKNEIGKIKNESIQSLDDM